MLSWIREKFGTVVIGGIIGFIGFVFVFFGVFNPKSTRGLHEGAVAGTVNGDPISISEFNRALNQRLEFFKSLGGDVKFNDEQLKAFRIKEGVFQGLVRRKLLVQEARRQGTEASDEEIKQRIQEIPVFQKDGKFDLLTYKKVLEANKYTPGTFERMMREDLSAQYWDEYFRGRARVSEEEIRREFLLTQDKRNIKYVLLTTETGRKGVSVDPSAIQKFLADPSKLNLARSQYEIKKNNEFKNQSFDAVKEKIARETLGAEKLDEIQKVNEKLAAQVLPLLSADKSGDIKINAALKHYGVEVKTTGLISRAQRGIPGLGDAQELLKDAFVKKSAIDPKQGGKAKKYQTGGWTVIALVSETQLPDPSKLEAEREKLLKQIASRKEREIYDAWVKKLTEKAKIDANPSVVGDT